MCDVWPNALNSDAVFQVVELVEHERRMIAGYVTMNQSQVPGNAG